MTTTETRAKYTEAQIKALGAKGHAFKNPDGHYSYPIDDEEDLHNAIRAVGRGGASHDAIRKYITGRAKAMGMSSVIPDNWTSGGSSASAQRDPAWEQRRRRWAGTLVGQRARRAMRLPAGCVEMRAKADGTGGTNFEFFGYGSTFLDEFEMWDRWGERYDEDVQPGAFTETLAFPGLDTPFLIGHNDAGIPLARTRSGTMHLSQDSHGLPVEALLSGRRSDVRDLADAVERGDMDEMSIGFVTRGQEWSEDWTKRHLTALDLHRGDVSVVALAANPATRGVSMTAFPVEALSRQAVERRAAANAAADGSHPPFTGTHAHGHPGYGAPGDGPHDHMHGHDNDSDHHHVHSAMSAQSTGVDNSDRAAAGPRERRGNPVDQDFGDASDYNVWENTPGALRCSNCSQMNSPAANFCDNCGIGGDALVRLDEGGVPAQVEEQGAAASLALRRRQLELLKLSR